MKVINSGKLPVLLVDGEELLGAKQNRVLNASILLTENSETIIPVSCTEHGRWHARQEHFTPSDAFIAKNVRARKNSSVASSLRIHREYRSDQDQVWNDIAEVSDRLGVNSDTDAYQDTVQARIKDIQQYIESLPCREGQTRLLVFLSGSPVGLDIFSSPDIYRKFHAKIIRSHALDIPKQGKAGVTPSKQAATDFIGDIVKCGETAHPSVGYGTDYRCQSDRITGAALVYGEEVIHGGFLV